ncbi:unnamed protein product [Camellia sinensis]
MAGEVRRWVVVVCVVVVVLSLSGVADAEPQVPCYFIFGDSLVDNGNNNNIASLARANYLPYGIDFPGGPTGRFSNGKTTVDVIAELLGFDNYIPPYSVARGKDILKGVNYASAAAGIRDETGQQLGARITMKGQVNNYKNTVSQVVDMLGDEDSAKNYLSQCIYSVGLGSNDYLNNYFMPTYYSTSRQYTPEQYAQVLIQQYSQQIRSFWTRAIRIIRAIRAIRANPSSKYKARAGLGQQCSGSWSGLGELGHCQIQFGSDLGRPPTRPNLPTLYNYGARKVVCIGVGQVGCIPNALAQNSPDGSSCVQNVNSANLLFNDQLKSLVDDFNNNLPSAKFIYINAYGIFHDLISRPSSFGFKVTNAGCCGVGRNNGQITCLPFQTPCQNRNEYLFWDAFHPGEAANIIMGRRSYSAESSSDAYPVDIRRLAQL